MKYITIICMLVAFNCCKQEEPKSLKKSEVKQVKDDLVKKLSGFKRLSARTMIDLFGEPANSIELLGSFHYIYSGPNESGYLFEIKEGTFSYKNPEQVVISAVRRLSNYKIIWKSSEYQEVKKKRGEQVLKEERLKKLKGLKKLSAKTMIDYFGEPLNLDERSSDPFYGVEPSKKSNYVYLGPNKSVYFFQIKEGTYSSKDLEKVAISAVHRHHEYKLIWQSEEENKKRKKNKK